MIECLRIRLYNGHINQNLFQQIWADAKFYRINCLFITVMV